MILFSRIFTLFIILVVGLNRIKAMYTPEWNILIYQRDYPGTHGRVYQMSLGWGVEEGYELVDGMTSPPGGVSYIRGYAEPHPLQEPIVGQMDNGTGSNEAGFLMKLSVCGLQQSEPSGSILTVHTLYRNGCDQLQENMVEETSYMVAEVGSIYVSANEIEGVTRGFQALICRGHNQLVYGIVSSNSTNCPAGQEKLHEFEFHAVRGDLFCPSLEPTPGMEIFYITQDAVFNREALMVCNPPYILNTSRAVTAVRKQCTQGGRWQGPDAACQYIRCGSPPHVFHGRYSGSSFEYLDHVTLECHDGYKVTPDSALTLLCLSNSTWSSPIGKCIPISCGLAPPVVNGRYIGEMSGPLDYPTVLNIQCDPGYLWSGTSFQRCQETGSWSQLSPNCIPRDCGVPHTPDHAYQLGDTYSYGFSVAYRCLEGFVLRGRYYVQCSADGSWSTAPTCERLQCPTLSAPDHGWLDNNSTDFGAVVMFGCDQYYNLIGEKMLRCIDVDGTAQWHNQIPVCEAIRCTNPENLIPDYAQVDVGDQIVGSNLQYGCDVGYTPIVTSTCTIDGWSEVMISCQAIRCEAPPQVTNGRYSDDVTGPQVHTTSLSIICDEGHVTSSSSSQLCQVTGTWSQPAPRCNPISCGTAPAVENGYYSRHSSRTTYPTELRISCNYGYVWQGYNDDQRCQADGRWSRQSPRCIRY